MVVPTINTEYFLQEIPELEITGLTEAAAVTVTVGDNSIDLTYFPSGGKIKLYGLSETVETLISDVDVAKIAYNANGIATAASSYQMKVKIVSGGQQSELQTKVRYCSMHVSTLADGVFMSRIASRMYDVDDNIYLSYRAGSSPTLTARLVCLGTTNDVCHDVVMSGTYASTDVVLYRLNVSMLASKANILPSKIMKIIFFTGADSMEVLVNHNGRRGKRVFVFDGLFGYPESVAFYGSETDKEQHEFELVHAQSGYSSAVQHAPTERKVESGALSEDMYNTVLDMLRAGNVYLEEGGGLKKVAIKDIENNHQTPRYSASSVSITYVISDIRGSFNRNAVPEGNLFEEPYSITFD